jgi:hypothetical protein
MAMRQKKLNKPSRLKKQKVRKKKKELLEKQKEEISRQKRLELERAKKELAYLRHKKEELDHLRARAIQKEEAHLRAIAIQKEVNRKERMDRRGRCIENYTRVYYEQGTQPPTNPKKGLVRQNAVVK